MRTTLSVIVALLSLTAVAAAQDFDAEGEAAMLARVNAVRAENHLAPLVRVTELDAVARAHSAEMASQGQLAHVSPTSGTPEDRVRRAGIPAATIAENVALHRDSAHAIDALLASPPHRANILSGDVTRIGLGAVRTERGVFVTQLFTSAPPEAPAGAAPPSAPVEAPAEDFPLIPPFVEQLLGAPAAVAGQVVPQLAAPAAPEAQPAPVAPAPAAPAPAPAPATPSAPSTEAPSTNAPTAVPVTPDTLRQLLGLAQALLAGAGNTTRAQ